MFRQYENIIDRELYEHYKKTRRKVANGANQYKLFVKCVSGLLMTIKELLIENENGVYLENFGYLSIDKKEAKYTKKISILRKILIDTHNIKFQFLDSELNKKYNLEVAKRTLDEVDKSRDYKFKKEAVEHYIKNIK